MAWDIFKPRGPTKASRPEAGGANTRTVPVLAIVKDNIDPIRAGRLQVYLSDFSGKDADNSNSWITVCHMSNFYGLTQASGAATGYGEFLKNPHSYGMWQSPPDIGTQVVCMFINGDPNYGYYVGSVYEPEALQMVPAIGSSDNIITNAGEAAAYGKAERLPVVNINTNNKTIFESSNFLNETKPVHSVVAAQLSQQGLLRDPIRGTIGSSSQRESPSRLGWGVSTPGRPVYEGGFTDETIGAALSAKDHGVSGAGTGLKIIARQGGHSLVMDDGDIVGRDQLVRLRTATGHQILMSDSGQTLFIIHANGQSWIELGKEGTIDMYATNSVNIRTQGDLNLHADNNININAAKALNIAADTIKMTSEKETSQRVGTDFSFYSGGKYTVKVGKSMSMASSGEASYLSDSLTYINGSNIYLNTGFASSVPAEVKPITQVPHTDTLFDASVGWAAAPCKLLSIVSRAPAHSPYAMAGMGTDVKVSCSASSQLPAAPAPAVAAANANAGAPANPVKTAVAATAPATSAVSAALGGATSSALVATVSTIVATGPAAAAAKLGAGIVDTGTSCSIAVGAFAASATQLVAQGVLKPGADVLINGLTKTDSDAAKLLTSTLFTGAPGAANMTQLVGNMPVQAAGLVTNLQQAQTALTTAGVITGKEDGSAIAGPVLAAVVAGPAAAIAAIQGAAGAVVGAVTGAVGAVVGAVGAAVGALGSAANALASGNFAGNLASAVTGGLNGLAGAVKSSLAGVAGLIENAKGVAAGAFAAITKSFKPLIPGIPQNLTAIAAKAAAAESAVADASTNPTDLKLAAGALGAVAGGIPSVSSITGAVGSVAGAIGAASGALGAVPGLSAVTGAVSSVTGAVNNISAAINNPSAVITAAVDKIGDAYPGKANG